MLLSDLILGLVVLFCVSVSVMYKQKYSRILSQKKSSEVRLGQIAEQLTPFLNQFNHDPKQARFIGMPIDLIVFEDHGIFFVEVKTGNARLSNNQSKYKKLVEEGKVFWEEIQIKPDGVKVTTFKLAPDTGRFVQIPFPTGTIPQSGSAIIPPPEKK